MRFGSRIPTSYTLVSAPVDRVRRRLRLSPIDLIPDPIPVIGHLDDLILLPIGIALAIRMIPDSVMADCRERARQANFDKPSQWKWMGAAFVVIVWLLIAMWMWRLIHREA